MTPKGLIPKTKALVLSLYESKTNVTLSFPPARKSRLSEGTIYLFPFEWQMAAMYKLYLS